jgi:hypothetical protein
LYGRETFHAVDDFGQGPNESKEIYAWKNCTEFQQDNPCVPSHPMTGTSLEAAISTQLPTEQKAEIERFIACGKVCLAGPGHDGSATAGTAREPSSGC